MIPVEHRTIRDALSRIAFSCRPVPGMLFSLCEQLQRPPRFPVTPAHVGFEKQEIGNAPERSIRRYIVKEIDHAGPLGRRTELVRVNKACKRPADLLIDELDRPVELGDPCRQPLAYTESLGQPDGRASGRWGYLWPAGTGGLGDLGGCPPTRMRGIAIPPGCGATGHPPG